MTKQAAKKIDAAGEKALADYCARYAVNRPFNSAEIPSLTINTMGTGRDVYNRDGGGTIATFSSTESARKVCRKLTGIWP